MCKKLSLAIIVILAVSSLLMVKPAYAQSIPVPSIPQFNLKLADRFYDVPAKTTSTTDPYAGKTTTSTYPAYHVQNLTIDISIRNQPFPAIVNGNKTTLYYDIMIKGHCQEDWFNYNDKGRFSAQTDSEPFIFPMQASGAPLKK